MSTNGNTEWKVTEAEFRGYTKAKLEEMNKRFNKLDSRLTQIDNKINCLNKFDKELAFKVGGLTAIVSFITTLLAKSVV